MVRRTKEEAQATREHLLDTAELVFQRLGVSNTSLHDIALAAGVTRGAIYWHFRDKADLFDAMMLRVTLPMEEASFRSPRSAKNDDPIGHLRSGFIDVLQRVVDEPQVQRVFEIASYKVEYVGELESLRERRLRSRDACLADLQRELERAARLGQIRGGRHVSIVAIGLHALMDGLLRNWLLDPTAFDLVRAGSEAFDAFIVGLTAPAAAPAKAAPRRSATARVPVAPVKARQPSRVRT